MKAVCLLVCLALARLSAANIFQRRHYPTLESFADADYVDPYLREYQLQMEQQQRYKQRPQYQNQYQPRNLRLKTNRGQYRQAQNQEQEQEYMQQRSQDQEIRRYADSSSHESGSQEVVQERVAQVSEFAAPRFADLNTPAITYRTGEVPVAYGDAVVWRGLEVAAGPKSPISEKDIARIFRGAQFSTKHIQPENQLKLHEAVAAAQTNSDETHLNATELLKKYNYPVEEHKIKTEDGYYLMLFRIPPKQQSLEDKPHKVVFLMHGLLGSADDWLLMGPGKSLAYQLADAGYDVYLGNARGSKYSHHVSKSRAQPDFWQYSNDEIALYDLPAMIDYIMKVSRQQKMYYVGHSQGTTAFFALVAARPEYNEKIAMMFALSPMVYMAGVRSPLIRMVAPSSAFSERLYSQLGNGEFKPSRELVHTMGGAMCEKEIGCKEICSNVYFVMAGMNVEHLNPAQIPSMLSHLPAGSSTKQMKQYGQSVDSGEFRMFDYGSEMNEKVYGQTEPPKYDMQQVTVPVILFYSQHDWMANPADVERLARELPNATVYKIDQDYFSHMDYQYSKQATEMVNKNLIESIQGKRNLKQQKQSFMLQEQENKLEKQTSY